MYVLNFIVAFTALSLFQYNAICGNMCQMLETLYINALYFNAVFHAVLYIRHMWKLLRKRYTTFQQTCATLINNKQLLSMAILGETFRCISACSAT